MRATTRISAWRSDTSKMSLAAPLKLDRGDILLVEARRQVQVVVDHGTRVVVAVDLTPELGQSRSRNLPTREALRPPVTDVLPGRAIAKRRVRSSVVVILLPSRDLRLCVVERKEDIGIEALIAEATVKSLDEAVFCGFPGSDEVELDAAIERPRVETLRRELRAVVAGNRLW